MEIVDKNICIEIDTSAAEEAIKKAEETTKAYKKGFYAGYAKGKKDAKDELNKLKEANKKLIRGIDISWTDQRRHDLLILQKESEAENE